MGRLRLFLRGFIPRFVPNRLVLFAYDLLAGHKSFAGIAAAAARVGGAVPGARGCAVMRDDGADSDDQGCAVVRDGGADSDDQGCAVVRDDGVVPSMIEDQRARSAQRFGRADVAYAGCEVIAFYNALLYLYGRELYPFTELIRIFERRGMVRHGLWGTSPKALRRFFLSGIPDRLRVQASTKRERFGEIARNYPCLIYSYYNDARDIFKGVHTICLTTGRDGLTAHNLTEDGRAHGPYPSWEEFTEKALPVGTAGLYLLGIRK